MVSDVAGAYRQHFEPRLRCVEVNQHRKFAGEDVVMDELRSPLASNQTAADAQWRRCSGSGPLPRTSVIESTARLKLNARLRGPEFGPSPKFTLSSACRPNDGDGRERRRGMILSMDSQMEAAIDDDGDDAGEVIRPAEGGGHRASPADDDSVGIVHAVQDDAMNVLLSRRHTSASLIRRCRLTISCVQRLSPMLSRCHMLSQSNRIARQRAFVPP